MSIPKLYLIPTPIGDDLVSSVLPNAVFEIVSSLNYFIVENEKSARKFIKTICPDKNQSDLVLFLLNKQTDQADLPSFLNPIKEGFSVGVLSEAGCPAVADPGSEIVALAHHRNIAVKPLVGPSSILLAMMSSGFNSQKFKFNGYLPIDKKDRKMEIKRLERYVFDHKEAHIFIETPYRSREMFEDILTNCQEQTMLCVACDLNSEMEYIATKSIKKWKTVQLDLTKKPCIFILGDTYYN